MTRIKFGCQGRSLTIRRWVRPVLYKQQAGLANLFPGGRAEEGPKLLYGTWKCVSRFPEEGVGTRWIVLKCGSSNHIVKPLSLVGGECDGVIAGMAWQDESRSSSGRFTDRLPAEPYEPPFCLWVILNNSSLEQMAYPCGRDTWAWH